MSTITVARALTEIKTLDNRIHKLINGANYITACKNQAKKVDGINTEVEFTANAKSKHESITDLIERRKLIKSAIVASNSKRKVTVGGVEYTVADAIERKASINYEFTLLKKMEKQRDKMLTKYNTGNDSMEYDLNKLLMQINGKESNSKTDDSAYATNYRESHGYKIVDPLGITAMIQKLDDDIDAFLSDVDACLSESNAISKIKV